MIIWLGSYPRSGIPALRFALHHCFGLPSYSLESDFRDGAPVQGTGAGYISHGLEVDAFLAKAEASDDIYLTRTLGSPGSGERAIYLMRDGRSATFSHWSFMEQKRRELGSSYREPPATLEEVVVGRTRIGSWSQHIEDWYQPGPNLLLLTYEALMTDDRALVRQAAEFLGRDPIRPGYLDELALAPGPQDIMRYEDNEVGVAEIMRRCPDLFEAAHGEMMRRLGYAPPLAAPLRLQA